MIVYIVFIDGTIHAQSSLKKLSNLVNIPANALYYRFSRKKKKVVQIRNITIYKTVING